MRTFTHDHVFKLVFIKLRTNHWLIVLFKWKFPQAKWVLRIVTERQSIFQNCCDRLWEYFSYSQRSKHVRNAKYISLHDVFYFMYIINVSLEGKKLSKFSWNMNMIKNQDASSLTANMCIWECNSYNSFQM